MSEINIPSSYKMTDRAMREETGLTEEEPVRGKREADTYWHTRCLTHSILGKHYRTPQANLNLLIDYLNSSPLIEKEIIDFSFVARTTSNLRFSTRNNEISFNAHNPIDKNDFLRAFGLKAVA